MTRTLLLLGIGTSLLASGGCAANLAQGAKEVTKSAPHVIGKGLAVVTENGSIHVLVDPGRTDVEIRARIRAVGESGEEVNARLEETQIVVHRREEDDVLETYVVWPEGRRGNEGCDFTIRIPSANGVTAKSANGPITLQGLGGAAHAETSNAEVTITDHAGPIQVKTSNGKVKLATVGGDVIIKTSNGGLEIKEVAGKVEASTSNGSIHFEAARTCREPFKLTTTNSNVTAVVSPLLEGRIEAKTSNAKINVQGDREGVSIEGKKQREIVLSKDGPTSIITTSNSQVTIILN